jgi:predicted NUDIX family NTP pyrophosphohydrolase
MPPPGRCPKASICLTKIRAPPPTAIGPAVFLGELRQPGGKRVSVWALEADLDISESSSNTFTLEWPRGSGRMQEFPEVDRVAWVSLDEARHKLVRGQVPFLAALSESLAGPSGSPSTTGGPG